MRKKSTPPKSPPFISIWTAAVLMLVLLLTGCKTLPTQPPPAPVRSVQIPPLPTWARQPVTPLECSGGCSVRLTTMRGQWQTMLTEAGSPD